MELVLRDIGKIYTKEGNVNKALSDINLAMHSGEFIVVTGKSGSGKSTLLNILSGLDTYEEGEMYVDGRPTSSYTKEDLENYNRENISFIFQDYNILESFTVLENVEYALLSITDRKERRRKAIEIIERVGLKDKMKTRGAKLSGGEKQRTVIARAIAKDSPIILADEPTGNLDLATAKEVMQLIKEISKDKLVVLVTHNYEDVAQYATRHIRLYDGGIELDETFDSSKTQAVLARDKYDFSDAHSYIFKEKKKKSSVRCNSGDIIALGAKRFSTRPRQAILMTVIMTVVLIMLFLLVGYTDTLLGDSYEFNAYYIDQINAIDGRVIVVNKNKTKFTKESAEELRATSGASQYVMSDKFLDSQYVLYKDARDRYSGGPMYQINIRDDIAYDEGACLTDCMQVGLVMPYNCKGRIRVGDTVIMSDAYRRGRTVDVMMKVGSIEYYVNRNDVCPKIIMTSHQYDKLAMTLRSGDDVAVSIKNGNVVQEAYGTVIVDSSLEGNDACVSGYQVNGQYYVRINGRDVALSARSVNDNIGAIRVSDDIFYSKDNELSQQVTLIFDDSAKKNSFLDAQVDGAYSAIDVQDYVSGLHTSVVSANILKFLTFLGEIVLLVIVAFVLVVAFQKLLYATRVDMAIFRTMGIDRRIIQRSTYVQLFLTLIPGYILMLLLAILMYYTPMGIGFALIGPMSGMMIFVGSVVLSGVVALSYNRVVFRSKIRKDLRRVNK